MDYTFSREVGTGSREENASRKECEARSWAVRKDANTNRCSIPISPRFRRALDGANGWAASRRRSSPRANPSRARLVGPRCNLDDLIADIVDELRARPYELVFVAGGWQFRTRPRFAGAIRAASSGDLRDAGAPELTPTEILAVTAIAYLQPATRAELSRLAGKEISRDVIGSLKRLDLIDGALRAPEPGAPFAYVTTKKFLEVFGLATLRDLPDIERLEDEGLLRRPQSDNDIDDALGLVEADGEIFEPEDTTDDT
jgi:chromosome segregation and condensation protein ScpB